MQSRHSISARGLSPRVRGNRVRRSRGYCYERSIPACAGEPAPSRALLLLRGVYPRVCGGTLSAIT